MTPNSNSQRRLRALWLAKGIGGLLCTGFGLSLFGEALLRKGNGQPWFWLGTLCLIVFNFGLCLLFDSHNHQLDWQRQVKLRSPDTEF
ncbi:MAG: hypothetical protein AAF651_09960 [Cyanobacteria bacterium P01_C01_bin.73]